MARKQARKRKQKTMPKIRIRIPKLPIASLSVLAMASLAIWFSYRLSAHLLDQPIRAITVEAPFQRVTALQIEEAISDELARGFLSANLTRVRERIAALPWIDKASVARRWPDRLEIVVTEQIPAACWGERGLLNTRGELFVANARHVPAELPRLSGPEGRSAEVARRYLEVRDKLIPLGLDVRRVHMEPRGAWEMTLSNGVEVRLGRRDVEERTALFLDIVANIVSSREAEIEFVDMRYSNGFTIGWKGERPEPAEDGAETEPELVAERSG